LGDELAMRQADRKIASTPYLYSEKRELDEKVAELEKRTEVVNENLKKARNRLLASQTRQKQLGRSHENAEYARRQTSSSSS
jgi:hypothetical protein